MIADGVRRVEAKMFLGWIIGEDGVPLSWEAYYSLVTEIVKDL
jgi:hypothetical protein